ncbi:hypothetical protein RRG08_056211 [Elysia crispata]|uniref:Uncharacterized protein n=1 Tax=Elysia crispata TaxID=231223 RepID=A0AAE0YKY0_9GAST|nr:hypothetical protein RRG08_056211 [Elysia crispata]
MWSVVNRRCPQTTNMKLMMGGNLPQEPREKPEILTWDISHDCAICAAILWSRKEVQGGAEQLNSVGKQHKGD